MAEPIIEIRKLDYLRELNIKQLTNTLSQSGFEPAYAIKLLAMLREIKEILGRGDKGVSYLNPEELRVFNKFKNDEEKVNSLFSFLDSSIFGQETKLSSDKVLRAVPISRVISPSFHIVPLGENVYTSTNPDKMVSVYVQSAFTVPGKAEGEVAIQNAKSALISFGKAVAFANSPYASREEGKTIAKELGKSLDKLSSAQKEPIQSIINDLKKGDIKALDSLLASGTAINTQLQEALEKSGLVFYDGVAVVTFRVEAMFRWELPSSKEFKEFLAGVSDVGLRVTELFLSLNYAALDVGATRFKASEKTGKPEPASERFTVPGHIVSTTAGLTIGSGLLGIPVLIDLSAEFGYLKYESGTTGKEHEQFYVGLQAIDLNFIGPESKKWPVRLSGMGAHHVGTSAKEDYLGYLVLTLPLRKSAPLDAEINITPYLSNFFGLLAGGAELDAAMKIFPTNKRTDFGIELSAGADLWKTSDKAPGDRWGIDPKFGGGLVYGPITVRGSFSISSKYGQDNPTGKVALEWKF
ncbi:TPA: hypothetical protein HA238_00590 [Candidatus Micrarchaeota archaeon]|nr:hypothetical protein [Candidatus Micrarchaeota archaeon]